MAFDEQKATEAAAYLLRLRGGRMSYLKLIKLLYLADREALARWGFSISNDAHYSMPHGPVVSHTYNLMIDEVDKPFWSQYITPPLGNYEIELTAAECPTDKLSRAEEKLLSEIFDKYGRMTRWQLRDFSHTLPEWHDPDGSSAAISTREILAVQGVPEDDILAILKENDEVERSERILGSVA
ncbi:Panacea domain-containing protein [Terriglobus sp. 2YAB30_2]|uniref:Panacea domain-containing protein n=1 Tax=unclassified Terriglobus TaxID=2628988 RepID=UPI003F9E068B